MDAVSSVDTDVIMANAEAERARQAQEQQRAEEARLDQVRLDQVRQAQVSQPVVKTASDVLGAYVNITA